MLPSIYRTLRDIADGHITLRVDIQRFDPQTGQPVSPTVLGTFPDRAGPLPSRAEWWLDYADEGWLRLPEADEPQCWQVTDAGREMLARHDNTDKETHR